MFYFSLRQIDFLRILFYVYIFLNDQNCHPEMLQWWPGLNPMGTAYKPCSSNLELEMYLFHDQTRKKENPTMSVCEYISPCSL